MNFGADVGEGAAAGFEHAWCAAELPGPALARAIRSRSMTMSVALARAAIQLDLPAAGGPTTTIKVMGPHLPMRRT